MVFTSGQRAPRVPCTCAHAGSMRVIDRINESDGTLGDGMDRGRGSVLKHYIHLPGELLALS